MEQKQASMEQKQATVENHLVANTSCSQAEFEAIANHYVANVDVDELIPTTYYRLLPTTAVKLNTMLGNRFVCNMDIMDLMGLLDEIGVRNQWKQMNAKISKELEGISQRVEESFKVLGENPPPPVWWHRRGTAAFAVDEAVVAQAVTADAEAAVEAEQQVAQEEVAEEVVAEPEPIVVKEEGNPVYLSLSHLPWGRWNYWYNHEVANHKVDEIKPQVLAAEVRSADLSGKASYGTWDNLMDDVVAWHKRGLHKFHVRMCICQSEGQ